MTYRVGGTVTVPYWDGPREQVLRDTDYAVMLDAYTGEVLDVAYNSETAETMVMEGGYIARVIEREGTAWEWGQMMLDQVRADFRDCFGVTKEDYTPE